jgi:hypothetical protein
MEALVRAANLPLQKIRQKSTVTRNQHDHYCYRRISLNHQNLSRQNHLRTQTGSLTPRRNILSTKVQVMPGHL